MPNFSERQKTLHALEEQIIAENVHEMLFESDSDDDGDIIRDTEGSKDSDADDGFDETMTSTNAMYIHISSRRYMVTKRSRSIPISNFMSDIVFNLPEKEFKQEARMSYEAFTSIVDMIKDDKVFHNASNKNQAPVYRQLIVALYRFGMYGNASSTGQVARRFGVGNGTTDLYTNRVIIALLRLKSVTWPTQEEKRRIKEVNESISGFPNCIGYVDGTSIPLAYAPVENAEDYYTRKSQYALAAMVVTDPDLRIRFVECGHVGSAHDTRVWRNSDLGLHPEKYFQGGEYLLGDKGYPTCDEIITPYKEPRASLAENKAFNYQLSTARVRVEHTIGVLKGRFQSLRGLRIVIGKGADRRKDHARAVLWFYACAILHNILLVDGDPLDWRNDTIGDSNLDDEREEEGVRVHSTQMFSSGEAKREYIKNLVLQAME